MTLAIILRPQCFEPLFTLKKSKRTKFTFTQMRNHFHVKMVENLAGFLFIWICLLEEKGRSTSKCFFTMITFEMFFACICSSMSNQEMRMVKIFSTIFTWKWFLVCVNFSLNNKVIWMTKRFLALFTWKGSWRRGVHLILQEDLTS